MRRAPALLALLLLAPALAALAAPAAAQPAFTLPTEAKVQVGGLNVTLYVAKDPRFVVLNPALLVNQSDPLGYLKQLYALNFTPGSQGVFYFKAQVEEPGSYVFTGSLRSHSPLVTITESQVNKTYSGVACPADSNHTARCTLNASANALDNFFNFAVAAAAPPGAAANLTFHMEVARLVNGTEQPQAARDHTYTLTVVDPAPPFAVKAQVGGATVYAWPYGRLLTGGPTGCLSTVGFVAEPLGQGQRGVLCVYGVNTAEAPLRIRATVSGPAWLELPDPPWQSKPFNASTGGLDVPVSAFAAQPGADAPLGPSQLTVSVTVERQENGTWVQAGQHDLLMPFTVGAARVFGPPGAPQIQWLAHGPVLVLAVGALGYLAVKNRRPRIQPRSRALREMAKPRDTTPEAVEAAAEQQRREVQEVSWEKKRRILEAKREDVLKTIRVAEERLARGEITETMLKGIKERKERQLEQIQRETEELR